MTNKVTTVYLAGGASGTWQDDVIAALPDVEFLDPRKHGLTVPAEYTKWDLDAIRRADVMIVGMDASNPSGYGLSLEVGFAHGLGKPILFLDLMDIDWRSKYFDMHRSISKCFNSVKDVANEMRVLK